MRKCTLLVLSVLSCTIIHAQDMHPPGYTLSLPTHLGCLHLDAPTFEIVEASAKPAGTEFGLRGQDKEAAVNLLVFLFQIPEEAPLTSEKSRDFMLDHSKHDDPSMNIQNQKTVPVANKLLAIAQYSENTGQLHVVRAFVAEGDLCSDIEFSSRHELSADGPKIKDILASITFDPDAKPLFREVFAYATVLSTTR